MSTVQSIERTFSILESFTEEKSEQTLSDISAAVNLPISTTSRLVNTLVELGFLCRSKRTFHLSYKMYRLGHIALQHYDSGSIIESVKLTEFLTELSNEIGEDIAFNVLVDMERVCIRKIENPHSIHINTVIGQPRPLYIGTGKTLLAFQSDEFIEKYLKQINFSELQDNGVLMNRERLLTSIEEIRKFGYSIENRSRIKDAVSITVPVFQYSGDIIGVISCGFLLGKTPAQLEHIKNYMLEKAALAPTELGFSSKE